MQSVFKKGDKVYIEGKLKTRKWQAEDGQQRYSTEVHVNEFNFLNNRNESTTENSHQAPPAQPSQPAPESQNQDQPDDLPF